jgi:hypothetical protein
MAQLPYLSYDQKPPMSCEAFKNLAKSLLSKDDNAVLNLLSLTPISSDVVTSKCNFFMKWQAWEHNLRLCLAKQRALKLKQDISISEHQTFFMDVAAIVLKVMDEKSPLKAEFLLDKARWQAIDDLAGNDYFHRNSVFAYFMKLLLIERRQSFDVEKGFAEYKSLYASIVESVHNPGDQQ